MNKLSLLVFIIIEGILAFYLGDAFWNPSKYVYTFGGDGAFIYYNMIFHTFFGDGVLLENMNYPKFESIFMTDAQAGLSLVFSAVHDIFPGYFTPEKVVGWSHRFHYIMIGVAGIYVLRTLDLLKVRRGLAVVSSVMIVLLSPMIIRLAAGHFGLAYPFVFAFTFYYVCQFYIAKKTSILSVIPFCLLILFFGLNNFYIGMINLTFVLLFALYMMLDVSRRRNGFLLAGQALVMVLMLYLAIHFSDPGMDRIEIQWGYLQNSVAKSSFFYPPTSLLHYILDSFTTMKTEGEETWINLGLTTIIILLISMPLLALGKLGTTKSEYLSLFNGLGLASFIMLLYASALFYRIPFLRDNVFHQISISTMFKASARFAWPIYFVASYAAVFFLQKILNRFNSNGQYILLGLVFIIWGFETHNYLDKKVFTQMYGNPYSQQTKEEFLNIVEEENIDLNNYQAIYSVPLMEGWNDKFQITPDFQSEYNSILFSMSTGIPMINGMLSRIGVTDAAESIQLSGNPLIAKEKIAQLDSTKRILLVASKEAKNLTIGEVFLLENSSLLSDQSGYQLRSLEVADLDTEFLRDSLSREFREGIMDSSFHIHYGFDEEVTQERFAGAGSKQLNSSEVIFTEQVAFANVDTLECSLFVKLDNKMYGIPQFRIELLDAQGGILKSVDFSSYKSKDIQDLWVRASTEFPVSTLVKGINLLVKDIDQPFTIDEVCLRSRKSNVYEFKIETNELLYNNYKWMLE